MNSIRLKPTRKEMASVWQEKFNRQVEYMQDNWARGRFYAVKHNISQINYLIYLAETNQMPSNPAEFDPIDRDDEYAFETE